MTLFCFERQNLKSVISIALLMMGFEAYKLWFIIFNNEKNVTTYLFGSLDSIQEAVLFIRAVCHSIAGLKARNYSLVSLAKTWLPTHLV